jgi:hypothetical protein
MIGRQKMSDPIDDAQAHMEREEEMRRKFRLPVKLEAEATGECLNCYEPVPVSHRWCNRECYLDWERWKTK